MKKQGGCKHASGASETFFELTHSRTSEDALLATRPNNVSLVNADAIQVVITVQGVASYNISNVDDVEALVELESQSDNYK